MGAHTLYLTPDSWDITLDAHGRLARSTKAYAIAQSVANAVRLFTRDAFFAQDEGIPHFEIELRRNPALSVFRARAREAALKVEGVLDAVVNLTGITGARTLEGEILLTVADGDKSTKITLTL